MIRTFVGNSGFKTSNVPTSCSAKLCNAGRPRFLHWKKKVRRFEYSLELAWKVPKDFLEESGSIISPVTPRQVIKEAFAAKIVSNGQIWIDMLDHRNLLSHTYDFSVFEKAVEDIAARYLPAMASLHEFFVSKNAP